MGEGEKESGKSIEMDQPNAWEVEREELRGHLTSKMNVLIWCGDVEMLVSYPWLRLEPLSESS